MNNENNDIWAQALSEQKAQEKGTAQVAPSTSKPLFISPSVEKLAIIDDIEVELSVEIGRTKLPIGQILKLSQGSVVELNVLAGEPLNVYVNNALVAQGEVVVVNDKFAIRLTDVVAAPDKGKNIK